ncbi:MAG: hypothetical protein ACXAC7_08060 [Candidatus Hodarchaeales archaeon]|jgi:DNA-binding HxlR family transcriptional regulator
MDENHTISIEEQVIKKLEKFEEQMTSFQVSITQQLNELESRVLASFQSRLGDILKKQFETELNIQITNLPCDLPDVETFCKNRKREWIDEYLNRILASKWDEAFEKGKNYQRKQRNSSDDTLKMWSKENEQCKKCASIIENNVMENQLLTLEALFSSFYSRDLPSKVQDLDRIDPEELYENKISPLANKLRVVLLILIFRGYRRFNELKSQINSSSSTTDHHLKKLLKHGLIMQDNKDYRITPDGVNALSTMLHLSGKAR